MSQPILFITSNRIGDAVLSSGVLAGLVARFPAAPVTVACGPLPAQLFRDLPGLAALHVVERRARAGHWLDLWRHAIGTRWGVVADLRGSALAWTLRAKQRLVCFSDRRREHRVEEIGRVFRLGTPPAPRLWVSDERQARIDARLGDGPPILAIGPTANWGAKQWPAKRFAEVARILTGPDGILPGGRLAVLGAPSEREAAAPVIAALAPERVLDLTGQGDLLDVFAALKRASFYIGNDSGLMHMAAAAGTPTLGLFGPSPEWRYGPYGDLAAVVRTPESFEELVVDNPSFDYRRQDCLMLGLKVGTVVDAANALWARRPAAPVATP